MQCFLKRDRVDFASFTFEEMIVFECKVSVALPMAYLLKPDLSPVYFTIGTFNFDPSLQVGEEVQISDWQIGWRGGDKLFNGLTSVLKRLKEVVPSSEKAKPDIFDCQFYLRLPTRKTYQGFVALLEV